MKQITVTALKRHLKERPAKDLINDIADLFSKFEYVKEYYGARLDPDVAEAVFQKYKQIIRDEFLPEHGFGTLRASVAKKALSDYKKTCGEPHKIADLTLFYAEMAAEFVCTYYICSEVRPPPPKLTPRPPLLRREGEKSLGDGDVPKPPSLPKRRGLGDEFKGGTNLRTDVLR